MGDPAPPAASARIASAGGSGLGWLARAGAAGDQGRRSSGAGGRAGRIALARRFRLGLAGEGRSGRLIRGRRSSRAGCRRRAHRPGQAVQAWAGWRGQERQAIRGRRSGRAGCRRGGSPGRRFRLGLAGGSRSGRRLIRGRRSSRAGCERTGASPGQAVPAWAGCRGQERQADQGPAIEPRRVPQAPRPGRRFRLGLAVEGRSGRRIKGRRSSRAGCRRQRLRGRLGAGTLLDRRRQLTEPWSQGRYCRLARLLVSKLLDPATSQRPWPGRLVQQVIGLMFGDQARRFGGRVAAGEPGTERTGLWRCRAARIGGSAVRAGTTLIRWACSALA